MTPGYASTPSGPNHMYLFYDDECPLCRLLSWLASIRPGLERVPLGTPRAEALLEGFDGLEHRPYILEDDCLYSGRKMVMRWLGAVK